MLTHLKTYNSRDNKYIEAKNNLVNNASNFYKGREKIIEGFKNKIFPIYYDKREKFRKEDEEDEEDEEKKQEEKQKEQEKKEKEQEKQKEESKFIEYIENKSKDIGCISFSYYFNFEKPSDLAKKLFEIKDKKKNNDFVKEIKSRCSNSNDSTTKTPRDKKILEIVKDIFNFNKQNQQGEGIKILTPNQMLNRLPIALAQLQAGNNSKKLKNEKANYCIHFIVQKT